MLPLLLPEWLVFAGCSRAFGGVLGLGDIVTLMALDVFLCLGSRYIYFASKE
jgi:hypothetical protein